MLFLAEQIAIGRRDIAAHQHRPAVLKDFVVRANADTREIDPIIDLPGGLGRGTRDVVNRAQRDRDAEHIRQHFEHSAVGTVTTQDQGQDEPPDQTIGHGKHEQHALPLARGRVGIDRREGLVDSLTCNLDLRRDELAADALVPGDLRHRTRSRQNVQSQFAALARLQLLGATLACLTRRLLQSHRQ